MNTKENLNKDNIWAKFIETGETDGVIRPLKNISQPKNKYVSARQIRAIKGDN